MTPVVYYSGRCVAEIPFRLFQKIHLDLMRITDFYDAFKICLTASAFNCALL